MQAQRDLAAGRRSDPQGAHLEPGHPDCQALAQLPALRQQFVEICLHTQRTRGVGRRAASSVPGGSSPRSPEAGACAGWTIPFRLRFPPAAMPHETLEAQPPDKLVLGRCMKSWGRLSPRAQSRATGCSSIVSNHTRLRCWVMTSSSERGVVTKMMGVFVLPHDASGLMAHYAVLVSSASEGAVLRYPEPEPPAPPSS